VLLMKTTRPLRVGKNGVTWQGLRYGQFETSLIPWQGKEVYLRIDERDVTRVQVWSPDDKLICVAPANVRVPANATEQQLRDAIAAKKRHRRTVSEFHESRLRLHDDLPDLMNRAAAERHAARRLAEPLPTPDGPGSILPVRSDLEDQLGKLRESIDAEAQEQPLRKAVGAERFTFSKLVESGVLHDHVSEEPGGFVTDTWRDLRAALDRDKAEDER
jgi:hypothetical protein